MSWFTARLACAVLALALIAATGAAGAAASSACEDALVLRGWQPLTRLAGGVPPTAAIAQLRRVLRWQQLAATHTELGADARRLRGQLWARLRDFDLNGLYETLPDGGADGRSLTLSGRLTGQSYRVERAAPAAFDRRLAALGSTTTRVAVRPLADPPDAAEGDHYQIDAGFKADVGALDWASVLAAKRRALGLWSMRAAWPIPARITAASGRANPDLSAHDHAVLAGLSSAFPATFDWFAKFATFRSLNDDGPDTRTQRLALSIQLDAARLRRRYPAVADYLANLGDFLAADIRIETDAGRLLRLQLDSAQRRVSLAARVVDGALVPTRNGARTAPAADRGRPLTTLAYRSMIDLRLKALGVVVHIDDWPLDWRYERADTGARFIGRIAKQPKVRVSGRALGVLPAGWLAALSPVDVRGAVHDFMAALIHGDHGRGARLVVRFDDGDNAVLAGHIQANTVANFMVRFSVRLLNRRLLPAGVQLTGLERLAGDGFAAIDADLDRLAAARRRHPEARAAAVAVACDAPE